MHPEAKSVGPDGLPCGRQTVGILRRRPVTTLYVTHVGKESNRLEEVEAGVVHDPEEIYTEYADPSHGPWMTLILPVLKHIPARRLHEQTGVSLSQVKAIRNGHAVPRPKAREALIRLACEFAEAALRKSGENLSSAGLAACAAYLEVVRRGGR